MKRFATLVMATSLAFVLQAGAQEVEVRSGYIGYVSVGSLELGIGEDLYRVDSSTKIHGTEATDLLKAMSELKIGTGVSFSIRTDGRGALIRELWLQRL